MKRAPRIKPTTPDLLTKVERLVALRTAHLAAIQGGDQSFYDDGRHEEMCGLVTEVHSQLNIRPWDDADEILERAAGFS